MTPLPLPVEDFRLAGCTGKDALDRRTAKQIEGRMNWARRNKTSANAYKCAHCGCWHLGARR